jgi:transglutaminase-like putative cysteine protease
MRSYPLDDSSPLVSVVFLGPAAPVPPVVVSKGGVPWELLWCEHEPTTLLPVVPPVVARHIAAGHHHGSPDVKNRAWRNARGAWVLYMSPGAPSPLSLEPFLSDTSANVVCHGGVLGVFPHGCPLLSAPFAVRRSLLEDLDGFATMPDGLEDLELGISLYEADAGFVCAGEWVEGPIAGADRPLTFEAVLALFFRHPYEWILSWACSRAEPGVPAASPAEGEALAARFERLFRRPVPARCTVALEELSAFLANRGSPPLAPVDHLVRAFDRALDEGLYSSGSGSARRVDRHHASNWLGRQTPYLAAAQATRTVSLAFPPPSLLGDAAEPLEIEIDGRYEVLVANEALALLREPTLSLAIPVVCPQQSDLRLFDFEPRELERYIDRSATAIDRFPLEPRLGTGAKLGYSFHCRVREATPRVEAGVVVVPDPKPVAKHHEAALNIMIAQIFEGQPPPVDQRARAQAIYRWIIDHFPPRSNDRLGLFPLEASIGHCGQRTRLFELLCARVGLTARARYGYIASYLSSCTESQGDRLARAGERERGHALIHIWPEVLLGDAGWWPLDFVGADLGSRTMSPKNILEPSLRQRIRTLTPLLDSYYFGRVDPYRVYLSEAARRLLGVPVGAGPVDLDVHARVIWGTLHQVDMTLRGLPQMLSPVASNNRIPE